MRHAIIALTLSLPLAGHAATTLLQLSGNAQREINNDQVRIELSSTTQHERSEQLADQLNRRINQAIAEARQVPGIALQSGPVSQWPRYDKQGKINGWQGQASLQLSGTDLPRIAALTARLQSSLQLNSVQFSVSTRNRQQAEQSLIPEAIEQLQSRAKVTAGALGKQVIGVRELTVGQSDQGSPRPMMLKASMAENADAQVAPAQWEAGKSTIVIEVSGKVELQ